jgi:hypothetical protein
MSWSADGCRLVPAGNTAVVIDTSGSEIKIRGPVPGFSGNHRRMMLGPDGSWAVAVLDGNEEIWHWSDLESTTGPTIRPCAAVVRHMAPTRRRDLLALASTDTVEIIAADRHDWMSKLVLPITGTVQDIALDHPLLYVGTDRDLQIWNLNTETAVGSGWWPADHT